MTDEAPEPILQFFAYDHLREDLKEVSRHFCDLASTIMALLPRNPERTVALRKLLEAKDAAVRAKLFHEQAQGEDHPSDRRLGLR
jgi:hypothetical protein